jgi:hypothetical protein
MGCRSTTYKVPIFLESQRTVFQVILGFPAVMLWAITRPSYQEFQFATAPNSAVIKNAINLIFLLPLKCEDRWRRLMAPARMIRPEQTDMKDRMDLHVRQQVKAVSDVTDSGCNWERSNPAWQKFLRVRSLESKVLGVEQHLLSHTERNF